MAVEGQRGNTGQERNVARVGVRILDGRSEGEGDERGDPGEDEHVEVERWVRRRKGRVILEFIRRTPRGVSRISVSTTVRPHKTSCNRLQPRTRSCYVEEVVEFYERSRLESTNLLQRHRTRPRRRRELEGSDSAVSLDELPQNLVDCAKVEEEREPQFSRAVVAAAGAT